MRNKKGLLIAVLALSALLLLFVFFRVIGTPSFFVPDANKHQLSAVDRGMVYVPIEATGVVEPENEVIILSPANSIIQKISQEPGSKVQKGDIIMELDETSIQNEIGQLTDQLEVKANSLERSRLDDQMARIDLDYNVEVKKLRIASIKAQLADEEQLLSVGGISSAKIDETKQNLVLAEKDLEVVQQKNSIRLRQMKTEETGLNLQIEIQKKQLADKLELLSKLKIKAPSDGIVLSVSGREGEKVGPDKTLITMSDLTTFKIKAMIDEKYSEAVKTGNPVFLIVDNDQFQGTIGNVTPTVAENKIQFNVHIDNQANTKLRANQSVKLMVPRTMKNNVLRISARNNFRPNAEQTIYILDSGRVVPRKVAFGIKGYEYLEVLSGLNQGDSVILTDSPFSTKSKLRSESKK